MASSGVDKQRNRRLSDHRGPARRALWAAAIYIAVGLVWIVFSDRLVEAWFADPGTLSRLQTWKGLLFVVVTGAVLFLATLRQFHKDRKLLDLQYNQRQALRRRERQLSVLMDNLPGMAYRCRFDEHWTMLFVSQGCERLTGYLPGDLVRNARISFAELIADPQSGQKVMEEVRTAVGNREPFSIEYPLIRKDGRQIWVWERGRGVEDDDGEMLLEGIILDISDRKALEDELEELATRDPLTGLYNRRESSRLLEEELERARRYNRPLALLWVDFDHFKEINDTHGHAAGDSVLKSVSQLLEDSVRSVDSVGRFGGEEFVIILPEMAVREAHETAERLRQRVSGQRYPLDGGAPVPMTISVGVAVYPDHGADAAMLCAAADRAMYEAKRRGRNCVVMAPDADADHNEQRGAGG
ncbi:sensor domain-containing diguanylate cyclase [Marinobacter pelagius]|uniref:sensor domain-containing diguanylate cyclase n=1 Tax=Marinobacter sp. C7 TaxID=2951363 RepID=UPI001EF11F32|nr:sensor domain-containing diguanylate cyclase [Marinobacter sp. C7]MCG7200395.1 sensor domain-containing diguanylate cyclase [Marinobacter sp. C7]